MSDSTGTAGPRTLAVYAIVDRKEKSYWIRLGAAFTNRDGSLTVFLDAVPVGTNRLQIREPRPWEEGRPAGNRAAAPPPQPMPEEEVRP